MRTVRLLVAGLFVMFIGSSAWAAACAGFTDVDSANTTYCSAVTYLKNNGVTLGCTGTTYCPNDPVTRLQMALFLQRMGKGDPTNFLGDHTTTIGGGTGNLSTAAGGFATVSGGNQNTATGTGATVAGGLLNLASAPASFAVGYNNIAQKDYAFVAGSNNNVNGVGATIIGGDHNSAWGELSTVLGGQNNTAPGFNSLAGGYYANAEQTECVVFSLWSNGYPGMSCLGTPYIFRIGGNHGLSVDYFSKRDDGGGTMYVAIGDTFDNQTISTWTGAFLSNAGVWVNASSSKVTKTEFAEVDVQDVLDKVAKMPITTWRYKQGEGDVRHIGPMAEDFWASFGVGYGPQTIADLDARGVAFAAIQGLNAKLEAQVAALTSQLSAMQQRLDGVASRREP